MKMGKFKEILPFLILSIIIFLFGLFYGYFKRPLFVQNAISELKEFASFLIKLPPYFLFLAILFNNSFTLFIVVFLSVIFGLPAFFSLILNGALLGTILKSGISFERFFWGIVPHGIFELPTFLIGGALGLKIGKESLKAVFGKENTLNESLKLAKVLFLKLILPLLILAAFIESTITPYLLWKMSF